MRTIEYKEYVGAGWAGLLDMMDGELLAADPDYSVAQVKEKFGRLTVYLEKTPPAMQAILQKYYSQSATVCERCGKPGVPRTDRHWVKTACDACAPLRPWGLIDVKADDDGA